MNNKLYKKKKNTYTQKSSHVSQKINKIKITTRSILLKIRKKNYHK